MSVTSGMKTDAFLAGFCADLVARAEDQPGGASPGGPDACADQSRSVEERGALTGSVSSPVSQHKHKVL